MMHTWLRRAGLSLAALLAIPAVALAYLEYATPSGQTVGAAVMMWLNGSSQAVPTSATNPLPVTTTPSAASGTSSLTATTPSATVASLVTNNAANVSSWPTASGNAPSAYWVRNRGSNSIAWCERGGTCTCSTNAIAPSNGKLLQAGESYGIAPSGAAIAYNVPTVVACSGTSVVEIDQ